jgi:hypothetical protein
MSGGEPEWISVTVVDVVERAEDGPRRARCQVGLVQTPGGDVMLAAAIVGRELVILPPFSAIEIIGALRAGLRRM